MSNFAARSLQAFVIAGLLATAMHSQGPTEKAADSHAAAADERQKKIQADADQLLALAQRLKDSIDRTRKDELSVQVVKEAAAIEDLAKSAKDRIHRQ